MDTEIAKIKSKTKLNEKKLFLTSTPPMPSPTKTKLILFLLFTFLILVFYLFTFNSGYGYDALEYLVIGRSLLDGYPFYAFIPSKSWGFYYLIASYLSLGNVSNHYGVSAFITLIFAAIILLTYLWVSKKTDYRTALLSSILVALCAIFMEMNFLEPEGLVYIFGLMGFYSMGNGLEGKRNNDLILGGFCFGVAFAFKSTAGFYLLAAIAFMFFWEYGISKRQIVPIIKQQLSIFFGLFMALIIPALWFAFTGRLSDYIEWSYYFPMLRYSSDLVWFYKLYTKLLWFFILLLIAFILSLRGNLRRRIYSNRNNVFVLFMGVFSLCSLFKTQAPHYLFPGAAFLAIYTAMVFNATADFMHTKPKKKTLIFLSTAVGILLFTSGFLYRPSALKRFFTFTDYSYERSLKSVIQNIVPKTKNAIFFCDSMLLYWITERYPNNPLLHYDLQAAYALRKTPEALLNALLDPNLLLVEFNLRAVEADDRNFVQLEC